MAHKIDIGIEVFFIKEGDVFVAYSPALNLSTQGDTLEKADEAFEEAFKIFIDEIVEMGTVEEVLRECGWAKVHHKWVAPTVVSQTRKHMELKA